MIRFRVDGRSAVPPYLQIVQQVRQALRMGVLDVGDQLPDGAGGRRGDGGQSQHGAQGLPRPGARGPGARPAPGTARSCVSRPPGPPPGTHSRLGRSLAAWVREARDAGLDDESIESLLRVTLQAAPLRRRSHDARSSRPAG